jgi:hypothetical protein
MPALERGADRPSIAFFPGNDANAISAIFAAGIFNNRWTVLRSQQQGAWATWHPVGEWPEDGTVAEAFEAFCDASGSFYVGGVRGNNGANEGWVRCGGVPMAETVGKRSWTN